jgi:cytoskeletal protein RodZ
MRKFGIATVLLLLAISVAVAQTSQESTTEKAKGAASTVAGAVKKEAEKTKEEAQKAYGATKNAVTGSSNNQTTEQTPAGTEGTSKTATARMPHTASPFPLIGLLGLGLFSLGALKRRFSLR